MPMSRRLFTGSAAASLLAARGARAASFTMQLTSTASGDFDQEWMEEFKKAVEADSHGQIRANVYPGSQLGSGPTTVEGVTLGTIEFTINASGTYEAMEPRFAVLSVPGLIDSMAQGQALLTQPDVRARLALIGRDKGIQLLTALAHSPVALVTRRPVKTLAELKGMKIRVPGSALLIDQLKQLGAAPIAMSLGEVLPAFQNGTIDGVLAGTTIFSALKYYDISKNLTLLPRTFITMVGLVNSGFMDSLGPLAKTVDEAAQQADVAGIPWGNGDVTNAQALWEKNGGQVFTLSADDAQQYLAAVVPVALKSLSPAGRADYEFLKAASAKVQ